jgi:arylsulfatase A-like enzyme
LASAATRRRAASISISIIRAGAVGTQGRSPKAQSLNDVTIPELERLVAGEQPFFLFLRHMDPHAPYLPPAPYERMFYHGNETDPENKSMEPVMSFKPFRDFFASWMPPGITDKDYVIAQYDGAIAYMDACIQTIFTALEAHGVLDETIVVINGDHGETLYDHECWFDHHGIYDNVLRVPLIIRYPGAVPKARLSAASISTKTWCRRFCNWPAFRRRRA